MALKMCFVVAIAMMVASASTDRTECSLSQFKRRDALEKAVDIIVDSCPPLLGSSDKEFCCYNTKLESHCCDITEFALNMTILGVIVLVVLLLVSSVVSCICCLCCPCCCLYKQRRGRVYRNQTQSSNGTTTAPVSVAQTSTEYKPLSSRIPPGAYPVLPTMRPNETTSYARSQY